MKIDTIFDQGQDAVLGIDNETKSLYWNGEKIVTDQRLSLKWWVNLSIVIGGMSTLAMAITAVVECLTKGG